MIKKRIHYLILAISAFAVVLLASTAATAQTAGLVSHWPAEGNAADVADGNDGTLQNGAEFAPGRVGQAFSLDGSDDFVEIPDSPSLNPSSFTIQAWIKTTQTTIGRIMAKPNGGLQHHSLNINP